MPNAADMSNCTTGLQTLQFRTREQFLQASALYRLTFGYTSPEDSLNPFLLSALTQNGGAVIGVTTSNGELVGVAYGFPGRSGERQYLYSQIAVVHPEHQGKGIGKQLKHAQRENALQQGFTEMRWVFDPFLSRNAHFNLRGLGAEAIALLPDFYTTKASDRILISWNLTQEIPQQEAETAAVATTTSASLRFTEKHWGTIQETDAGTWIPIPRDYKAAKTPEVREKVLATLRACFDSGKRLHDCIRVTQTTAAYQVTQGKTQLSVESKA